MNKRCCRVLLLFAFCILSINISEAKAQKRIREAGKIEDLRGELRNTQFFAPPWCSKTPLTRDVGFVVIHPDTDEWAASLTRAQVPERAADGSESWPFFFCEEDNSHDCLLLNGESRVLQVFKADAKYDRDWVARMRVPGEENWAGFSAEGRKVADYFSPSRVRLKGRFVLPDHPSVTGKDVEGASGVPLVRIQSQAMPFENTMAVPSGKKNVEFLSKSVQAALKGAQGISGENPGFPEEGYKDYLYVQYGYDHPFLLDSSKNVRSVISTLINTLVIFDDGTVSGIGCDPRYENPSGDFPEFPDTRPFGLPANITNIVSAAPSTWKYFMFLQGNGHVTSWGDSAFAFGRDTVPARVTNAISVAAGNAHAVAVLNDGRVAAWGNNSYRQTAVPANLVGVKSVAAGYNHTLALLQNGNVVAWGSNEFGETNVPSNVTDATSIAAGYCFSLVLLADGHVVAWGCDWYGQNIVPDDVTNAVAIAVADEHCLALLEDGRVVAWGGNSFGQTDIPEYASDSVGIAAGYDYSAALLSDGSAAVWGGWAEEGVPVCRE